MKIPMRSVVLGLSTAALALPAMATTRSSFLDVSSIVNITAPTSNVGRTYTVALGSNPSFTYGGQSYAITSVTGFYVLSDDKDFSPLSSLGTISSPGPYSNDSSNSGPGGMAGWKANPNDGLVPGQTLAFTLPSNFPIADIDRIGFHVSVDCTFPGTSGNTGNITGTLPPNAPAPGPMAAVALGGLMVLRRKR